MAVQISGNDITVPRDGSFTRNVTIGGTLTYEDVTNIDSVGLVTARSGIEIGARPGVAASISVDGNMIVSGISTFGGDVQVPDKIIHSGDTNTAIRFPAADTITAETGGSERLRIDSSGRLLINKTSDRNAYYGGTLTGNLQVEGLDNSTRLTQFIHNSNAASQHILVLGKSRGTSAGSYTVVQNSDYLGTLSFQGADGDAMIEGARIDAIVTAAPGDQDMPTALTFGTTADSASSTTERLRIASGGDVTVKTGNLVIGTAGKGIDFSAQTASSATGATATSEILDHYEEGTWTPTSNAGAMTIGSAHYVKIGSQVTAQAYITFPSMSGSSGVNIASFPYSTATSNDFFSCAVQSNANAGSQIQGQFSNSTMTLTAPNGGGFSISTMSGKVIVFSITYTTH